jgi:uncharacterized delta-60 repeat protein
MTLTRWRKVEQVLFMACALVFFPASAGAHPGDLDPTFGQRGAEVVPSDMAHQRVADLAVASNDAIVIGGSENDDYHGPRTALVARFLPGGLLDPSFADDGVLRTTFGYRGAEIQDVEVYPDGRIAALISVGTVDAHEEQVVRLLPDGSLDPGFSSDGFAAPEGLQASALDLQTDGSLVVGGHRAVARLDLAREIEPTFAGDGIAEIPELDMAVTALELDGLGRIVFVGPDGAGQLVGRIHPDGQRDDGFGTGGFSRIRCLTTCGEPHLVLNPEVGVVVALQALSIAVRGGAYTEIWRLTPSGTVDAKPIVVDHAAYFVGDVAIGPGGQILRAAALNLPGDDTGYGIRGYRPDGGPDDQFGTSGKAIVNLTDGWDSPTAIALQSDGRIVLAGVAGSEITVARFLMEPGARDQDGDGVLDSEDACRIRASARRGGCAHYRPDVVLQFGDVTKRERGFLGYLASPKGICLPGVARPTLMRVRSGSDLRIGQLRLRSFDEEIQKPGPSVKFAGVSDPRPAGTYYVRTRRLVEPAVGICQSVKSNRLRFG